MKKTLIALAALAVVSAASAQVTIGGLAVMSYQRTAGTGYNPATTASPNALSSFAVSDLTLTVNAKEDLGAGSSLSAAVAFDLGGARNSSATRDDLVIDYVNNAGTFRLRSIEAGNYAEKFSGVVYLDKALDSTNSAYKSIDGHANIKGAAYYSPEIMPGLKLNVGFSQYEQNVNSSNPAIALPTAQGYATSTSIAALYAKGPVVAQVGYSAYNTGVNAGTWQDSAKTDIGLSYDFGVAKVGFGWMQTSAPKTTVTNVTPTIIASVSAPIGGGMTVGLDYARKGSAGQSATTDVDVSYLAVGLKYNLSKTAFLQASVGGFSGQADANIALGAPDNSTQYRFALGKTF